MADTTKDDIRGVYADAIEYLGAGGMDYDEAVEKFDRWLAEHDREIEASALERVAANYEGDGSLVHDALARGLRDRAAIIRTSTDIPTPGCVFCGKPREFVNGGEWAGWRCADTKCKGWATQHLPDDAGSGS